MLGFALTLVLAVAAEEVPAPLVLTDEETVLLAAREIVVRDSGQGSVIGVVDVRATPRVLLEEVLNLPARVEEVGPLQQVSIYHEGPSSLKVRMEVGMLGIRAAFHVAYDVDWDAGWCTFHLDPARENDIDSTDGSYQVYAAGDGARLVYRSEATASGPTPGWLRDMLTSHSMTQQMEGMRVRAETRSGG